MSTIAAGLERTLYAGIFQEEVCVHFLNACVRIVHLTFRDLWDKCNATQQLDGYRACLASVRQWEPAIFEREADAARTAVPNVDDLFRGTFVVFVKSYHQRPGCPRIQIRLTVPPFALFARQFLTRVADGRLLHTGHFFAPDHALLAKDACMDICRDILVSLLPEFVLTEEVAPPPPPPVDDVQASDSASNVDGMCQPPRDPVPTHRRPPPNHLPYLNLPQVPLTTPRSPDGGRSAVSRFSKRCEQKVCGGAPHAAAPTTDAPPVATPPIATAPPPNAPAPSMGAPDHHADANNDDGSEEGSDDESSCATSSAASRPSAAASRPSAAASPAHARGRHPRSETNTLHPTLVL